MPTDIARKPSCFGCPAPCVECDGCGVKNACFRLQSKHGVYVLPEAVEPKQAKTLEVFNGVRIIHSEGKDTVVNGIAVRGGN